MTLWYKVSPDLLYWLEKYQNFLRNTQIICPVDNQKALELTGNNWWEEQAKQHIQPEYLKDSESRINLSHFFDVSL